MDYFKFYAMDYGFENSFILNVKLNQAIKLVNMPT